MKENLRVYWNIYKNKIKFLFRLYMDKIIKIGVISMGCKPFGYNN